MSATENHDLLLADERLAPYWPLVLAVWFDGVLTNEETLAIGKRLTAIRDVDPGARKALAAWLDPRNPPSPDLILRLGREVRDAARAIPGAERLSLTDLAMALAPATAPAAHASTRDVLNTLGTLLSGTEQGLPAEILRVPQSITPQRAREPAAVLDIGNLTRLLDGRHAATREEVRAMLREPIFRYPGEITADEYRRLVLSWLLELARRGFGRRAFPKVLGTGDDIGAFIASFETLAHFDLSLVVKYGVQFGLFGGSIYFLGSESQQREWLPRIASGEVLGCFAMSELGHGSNVRDLETIARFDASRDEWVIDSPTFTSRKEWIGNAALHGSMATVFAQLQIGDEAHGVHAFLVPIRDGAGEPMRGVAIEDCGHKMGLNGVDNGRLRFTAVRIPRGNLLDRFAQVSREGTYASPIPNAGKRFFTMLGTLVGGRVSVAAGALSGAKSALTIAVRYGVRRRQFGAPGGEETLILDYPAQQRRIMPALATTYAVHFAVEQLAQDYVTHAGDDTRELEARAAGVKAFSTSHATRTIQMCREACGGQGYLSVNRLPALKADTDVFATFEGDNTVLLQLVAKSVLTDFRQQFFDGSARGVLAIVARRASASIDALNPVLGRRTADEHLLDRKAHLEAFRFREETLVYTAARRIKKRVDAGSDPFAAFTDVQNHLVVVANANVERVIFESFSAAVDRCTDAATRAALDTLCNLFALSRFEDASGWFLESGYFEPARTKAVRKMVERLCREVRALAPSLVEAFAIPDSCISAPIAFDEPVGM